MVVLDRKKRPLMPCTPKRARKLLEAGRARVHLLFPFRIRLVERIVEQSVVQPLRLSVDPASNSSGLAISRVEEVTDAGGVIEPVMHIVFLREYLLKKFNRMCAYCDVQNVPLQIEHIEAKARAGSNRVSNLALACGPCNAKKAAQDMGELLFTVMFGKRHKSNNPRQGLRPLRGRRLSPPP